MHTDIIDKFTTHLKNALTRALGAVQEQQTGEIEPGHLFWALATQKGSIGAEILHKMKLTETVVGALVASSVAPPAKTKPDASSLATITPKLSPAAKRAIEKAVLTANLYEHKYVGTEHLLSGLLQIEDAPLKKFIEDQKVDTKALRHQVMLVLKSTSKFPDLAASLGVHNDHELSEVGSGAVRAGKRGKKSGSKTPALDFFSTDLTGAEAQERIDPVIGREEEIERIMQILCRRTKNNPILLGDPGVGKTALVEGLAKRLANSEVPEALRDRRILAVDLSLIVAGTMYRGEFEGRLKQIIDEVKVHPEIILFIDEVHTIIGAGSSSGSLDAANILKPALSRGEIRCIGATTLAEYKKHFESDAALERRFQPIMVNEPTPEKTIAILEGIKKNYESYHGVTITKEAIQAAVTLSGRYIQEKFFPDKAIDLIDEAASSLRVREKPTTAQKKLRALTEELAHIREEKRQAVMEERFIEAISLKERERALEETQRKLTLHHHKKQKGTVGRITAHHIAEMVSRMTGVPVTDLIATEKERLQTLETALETHVIGQEAAVRAVAELVRRAKTGIAHPARPLASFLFVGPSGVGKTELAKALAEELFQDKDAFVRLDMSEFAEGFTTSKLIGAPAGYVGYRDSAKLTDAIKRKPYAVVLFDELEKAHGDVLNLLLQILDEGHISDATGRTINFKNTILIMTSNVGSDRLASAITGFGTGDERHQASAEIITALRERFRPEFLNRIDRICPFRALDEQALARIVDRQIKELNDRLAEKNMILTIDESVRAWIVSRGTNPEHGARAIRRVIQDHIENQLAALLLEPGATHRRTIPFIIKNDVPVLQAQALQRTS